MRVISNTAISVDGRINTVEDRAVVLGSKRDHEMMSLLRSQADALLIGGATFRHWPRPLFSKLTENAAGEKLPPLLNVVVTRRLDMEISAEYLAESRIRPLFLVPSASAREDFPAPVESYSGEAPSLPIPWILKTLEARGVRTLLVEAGGDLLYQFLAADALDEMFVTLCPKLIGGPAPTLVDGAGFTKETMRRLSLKKLDVNGDEIFLHYIVYQSAVAGGETG